MFSMMILPFVFVVAMLPQNVLNMYDIIVRVGQIGLLITVGYPLLLLLMAGLRKKRGDSNGVEKKMGDSSSNKA
jgi:spore germination protein